jgi:hypothetical protein
VVYIGVNLHKSFCLAIDGSAREGDEVNKGRIPADKEHIGFLGCSV